MLQEIGLADAYGAGFEFTIQPNPNDLSHMWAHPTYGNRAGTYTDDTQMSVANAKTIFDYDLLKPDSLLIDPRTIVVSWLTQFRFDPRKGYAKGFQTFLESCETADDFLDRIKPDSEKNGAAMRAVPWGLIPDLDKALELSKIQASITHNTESGTLSSQAVTYLAYCARHNVDFTSGKVISHMQRKFKVTPANDPKITVNGLQTVCNAYGILLEDTSMKLSSLLKACCYRWGDTDTIAAIVIGIASLSSRYENDFHEWGFYKEIENGWYGINYLVDFDTKLGLI